MRFENNAIYNGIKNIKYLRINAIKYVQNLRSETLVLQKVKEDLNKWRDIPCSWIGRFGTLCVCVCVCVCDDRAKQGDSEYLVPIPMRHSNKNNSHIYG